MKPDYLGFQLGEVGDLERFADIALIFDKLDVVSRQRFAGRMELSSD